MVHCVEYIINRLHKKHSNMLKLIRCDWKVCLEFLAEAGATEEG